MTRSTPSYLKAYAIGLIAVVYAPILLLPVFSFNNNIYVVLPLKGFTFEWYRQLIDNAVMQEALVNSLSLGAVASILSTAIATATALGLRQPAIRGSHVLTGMIILPLVVPPVVLGVALLGILHYHLALPASLMSVAIGHTLLCLPFAFLTIASRLQTVDRNLEEASRDLGETALATFVRVTLPLAAPAIASSLLLCFTISFDEFVLAFFLSGNEPTLPVFIFSQLRFPNRLPGVLALGACILATSFCMIIAAEWARRMNTYQT